jgi:hypothetical protein
MRANVYMINENVYGFTRKCFHCGEESEFYLSFDEYERLILNNEYIQDVFPFLSKELREVMISGTHPNCWEEMFSAIDEDECECEEMEQGQPCVHCIETKYE